MISPVWSWLTNKQPGRIMMKFNVLILGKYESFHKGEGQWTARRFCDSWISGKWKGSLFHHILRNYHHKIVFQTQSANIPSSLKQPRGTKRKTKTVSFEGKTCRRSLAFSPSSVKKSDGLLPLEHFFGDDAVIQKENENENMTGRTRRAAATAASSNLKEQSLRKKIRRE